jgi:hypothetical protein
MGDCSAYGREGCFVHEREKMLVSESVHKRASSLMPGAFFSVEYFFYALFLVLLSPAAPFAIFPN